jgi:5-methyltetrahydropteroyltriglutamate--homocysteine methyltransferase
MKRSTAEKILTTHVGSLPLPDGVSPDIVHDDARLGEAVATVVRRQSEIGLDVINEGEYTKGGDWLGYLDDRFGGFVEGTPPDGVPVIAQGRDRETFADFYRYAAERGTLFYTATGQMRTKRPHWVCTAPVTYAGGAALAREIATLVAAVDDPADAFLTSTAPSSIEPYRTNAYYATQDEFVFALGEALREEYEAIAAAGLTLQIDDAWLPALWDRIGIDMGLAAFRARCMVRVEALNAALRNVPEAQIRYHLCWGSWHGPHAFDLPMEDMVDIMLSVKAGAYLFDAANVRHEHEYAVWERVKLPAGKIIIPGVITHSTDVIEHPELVAQRIRRFADLVGPENLIAGADCGFGGRTHPQIAWAKLRALTEGAALASRALAAR